MLRASRNSGTWQAGKQEQNGKPVRGWTRAKVWVLVISSRRDCGDCRLRLRGWSEYCLLRPKCTPLVCGRVLPLDCLLNMFKPSLGTRNSKAIGSILQGRHWQFSRDIRLFGAKTPPRPHNICHARCLVSRSTEARDKRLITSVQSVHVQSKIHSWQVVIVGIKFHSLEPRIGHPTILTGLVRSRMAYILIVIVSIT